MRFFDDERQFAGQAPDYDAYQRCFAPSHDGQVLGEATPTYMFWDAAPERIRAYNPRMKLLLVLRNPIARAFSHWHMEQARGRESMDFGEVIRTEGRRMQDAPQQQRRTYSYVARGFYSRQILRLWSLFPRHQTLIIRNKTLLDAHRDVLALISRFLAIEPFPETGALTAFAQACRIHMAERDRAFLCTIFREEIKHLERLLGWDCANWMRQ